MLERFKSITSSAINDLIESCVAANPGADLGIAAVNLASSKAFFSGAETVLESASVIKTFLCYQYLVQKGDDLERLVALDVPCFQNIPGAGVLTHLSKKSSVTVDDLLFLMMGISDNGATNWVIDELGGVEAVNAFMRQIPGVTSSCLHGRVEEDTLVKAKFSSTTAADLVNLILAVLDSAEEVREKFYFYMAKQVQLSSGLRIGRRLPLEGFVKSPSPITYFGSKGGTLSSAHVSTTLVVLKDTSGNHLIIAALTRGLGLTDPLLPAHIDHPANVWLGFLGEELTALLAP